jgi:inorganic pyrophosphatase
MAEEKYSLKPVGKPETMDYKAYFFRGDKPISPFHDIPLWIDKSKRIANMVVEIPRGTQAKLEINKDEFLNPIKQDVKNGKLRYVALKYPFNYGALPQTWENPATVHPDTKAKGDNDPIDAVDLSSATGVTGQVKQVKVLGTYAMIDEGETDWKVVVIDVNDPLAKQLNTAADVQSRLGDKLKEAFEFLRDYKKPDGKPENKFAFDNKLKDENFATGIVDELHNEWKTLMKGGVSKISVANTTGDKNKVSLEEALSKLKL